MVWLFLGAVLCVYGVTNAQACEDFIKKNVHHNDKSVGPFIKKKQMVRTCDGYGVHSSPTYREETIDIFRGDVLLDTVGYVVSSEGKFYLTKWSYQQYLKGRCPNWTEVGCDMK